MWALVATVIAALAGAFAAIRAEIKRAEQRAEKEAREVIENVEKANRARAENVGVTDHDKRDRLRHGTKPDK